MIGAQHSPGWWRLGAVALAVLVLTVSRLASAEPFEPRLPNGECKRHWRGQGFSAGAEDPLLSTTFDPAGTEAYADFYRRLERDRCWKEWLVLVYMAADNDLAPFSYRDLWEMQAVGSLPSMDVVAFHADGKAPGARYYHVAKNHDQEDYVDEVEAFAEANGLQELSDRDKEIAWLEKHGPELVVSPVAHTLSRGTPRDPGSLGHFLEWAAKRYPSRRILFIAWGHGKGFDASAGVVEGGAEAGTRTGGPELMPVTDLVEAVRSRLLPLRGGKALDLAGSDACLNQQVEFGYEWRGVADYVFGSSTIVQKKGFNYRTLLKFLGERPGWETYDVALEIPRLYGGSVGSGSGRKYSGYYDPHATMALWASDELRFLRESIDELAGALLAWIRESPDEVEQLGRALDLRTVMGTSLRLGGVSNDLHNVLQVLEGWARDRQPVASPSEARLLGAVRVAVNGVGSALQRAVLAKHIGPKYVSQLVLTSKGVAIWLPASDREWKDAAPRFERSRFWRSDSRPGEPSAWAQLIRVLFGA